MGGKEDEGARFFSVAPGSKIRDNEHKLKYVIFHLNTRKSFFTLRIVKHRLFRRIIVSQSLDIFKTWLNTAIKTWSVWPLLEQESWTRWSQKIPSNFNNCVILWFDCSWLLSKGRLSQLTSYETFINKSFLSSDETIKIMWKQQSHYFKILWWVFIRIAEGICAKFKTTFSCSTFALITWFLKIVKITNYSSNLNHQKQTKDFKEAFKVWLE